MNQTNQFKVVSPSERLLDLLRLSQLYFNNHLDGIGGLLVKTVIRVLDTGPGLFQCDFMELWKLLSSPFGNMKLRPMQ